MGRRRWPCESPGPASSDRTDFWVISSGSVTDPLIVACYYERPGRGRRYDPGPRIRCVTELCKRVRVHTDFYSVLEGDNAGDAGCPACSDPKVPCDVLSVGNARPPESRECHRPPALSPEYVAPLISISFGRISMLRVGERVWVSISQGTWPGNLYPRCVCTYVDDDYACLVAIPKPSMKSNRRRS